MTALLDQLRLEILATSAGNMIANHSTQDGDLTGWSKKTSESTHVSSTVSAASGLAWGYNGRAFKLDLGTEWVDYYNTRDYGVVSMVSGFIPVVGLQWVNVAATFRAPAGEKRAVAIKLRFYNSAGAELGQTEAGFGVFGGWVADADNVLSLDNMDPATGSIGAGEQGPVRAPSGTTKFTVTIQALHPHRNPGNHDHGLTYVSDIMVGSAGSKSLASGLTFSDVAETWQNLMPKAMRARVTRGGDVDGVTDKLEAGMLICTVKDPLVTPENNERVRPGRPIRLMGLNGVTWEPVFTGKLSYANTSYAGEVPVVTLTATDAMAALENYPKPVGKSGRFKQRIDSLMLDVPVSYTVADAAADVAQATISADEQASAGSQLSVIRDSLRGLYYVARSNVLKCFANNSYPSQAATVTLSDDFADVGAIYYLRDGIVTNFDSKNMVNTLTVTKVALSEPGGKKVYGPYINQASVDAWGSVSADITINDGTPSVIAAAYLAIYANPTIFTESVVYDATDKPSAAIARELYEAARVKFSKAGVNAVYRVISIEHDIATVGTSERWTVTLRFKPMESTTSIVVINPPGGADTGPKDTLPFTREIQTGSVSVPGVAGTTTTAHVNFPIPYESVTGLTVLLIANTSVPQVLDGPSYGGLSATGFDVYLRRSTSGATTVRWVAIPASTAT